MLTNSDSITELLLICLYDDTLLEAKKLIKLKESYATRVSIEDPNEVDYVLDDM